MRDERGTATLLIVGLALVLAMMAAVVTDASAAYLQRQGLDTLADGAALTAADAGASGEEAYGAGLGDDLHLDPATAMSAVLDYLHRVRAYERYPGLTACTPWSSSATRAASRARTTPVASSGARA